MNTKTTLVEPDWSLLRAFLAVAETGSLSRAALELGSSQPTLSRQMSELETQIGHALFERTRRGVQLTEAGQALRLPAQRMREHAREWSLAAAGRATSLAGTVRITASEMVSAYLLPSVLRDLRTAHPEIQIELVPSDKVENLLEREADIALRMIRPTQTTLVARKVADLPMHAYAHRDYIKAHGKPTMANFHAHQWVGFDRSDQMLRGFHAAGYTSVTREFFGFRCDNQIVAWRAACAGIGIGVGMERVAKQTPEMTHILPEIEIPPLQMWITAHRELRGTPRLKLIFEALVEALK
ncbi:MAG: LysR family transcriptional regulator [Rhizobacter sp.]